MALQTSTGYVRIVNVSLGQDNKILNVHWMTFRNSNWQELNPERRWTNISENGSYTFDLSIKEKQLNEQGEEVEVITGYLPQTLEQAHELLRNLSGKDCNFKAVNFQIVI
jgi:hypothetical protein